MKKDYGFKPTPVDENKEIEDYTKKEAKLMFEWYLDDLPKRTAYLFDYINMTDDIPLEYTFDTFKKVVNWMAKTIRINYLTEEALVEKKNQYPEFTWSTLNKWKFTEDSELIIAAVGGYLGMVMLEELPNSKWELDLYKNSASFNQAVIRKQSGGQLEPAKIANVIAAKIVDGKELRLDKTFKSWRL